MRNCEWLPCWKARLCPGRVGILLLLALCRTSAAADENGVSREKVAETRTTVQTYTYKKVGDLEIQADVHRVDDESRRPVVVWIHGGALIVGSRTGIDRRARQRLLEAGFVIVSIDYRLAPETQLEEIIQDLEDAFRWVHEKGAELFQADTRRVAVMGGSAGGYLTLAAGFRARPRPQALVAFYGYGDLIGDWYSTPSPHPRHHRIKMSREEAFDQVSGPPISDSSRRKGNGGAFYQYCRQNGLWPKAVSGWDPRTEAKKYDPFMPVKNVTSDYPPTLLIHGNEDTDVPYEQSVLMAEQFEKHGVPHELITIDKGEHGFGGGDPEKIEAAYDAALEFVKRRLKE